MARRRIVPVEGRRVPLPLAAGGADLGADGAWIDNEIWVRRRLRDGDVRDVTEEYVKQRDEAEAKAKAAAKAAATAAPATAQKGA